MSVKLRLTRTGANKDVCFRVVAADTRSPRDGRFIEILGWYNPKQTGRNSKLKLDRIDHWLGEGAQASDTVRSLIKKARNASADEVVEVAAAPEAQESLAVEPEAGPVEELAVVVGETVEAVAEAAEPVQEESGDDSEITESVEDEPKTVAD